ncbi:MAG TPA: dihydroorotase [Flavobacterium lutivivi]|nr:dihydroorotase [Flavobacterium lutivivi]
MNLILRNTTIIDQKSSFNKKTVDILISDGIIQKIGNQLENPNKFQEIQIPNLHVSSGWFDTSVSFGEPGYEDSETISNGLDTAAKSGFTGVMLQPNTNPIVDNQSLVHFIKQKSEGKATQVFPIGALTKNSDGKDLAELFDMKNAGAVAFGDYNKNISNANLMKIALQYVQDFDGQIIAFSQDENIKGNGVVNEGIVSTKLGLKGIPNLAEELIIERNLFLLEYTGGKIHIPTISTAKSVELIKEAKEKKLNVTCSVSVNNLALTDELLKEFDTRHKVLPPLRNEVDRLALINGILDDTIDFITTDHNPIDIEHKKMEFDLAKYGTIGLESAFGALNNILPLEKIIQKLTYGKNIFTNDNNSVSEGEKANLTLFTIDDEYIFGKDNIISKSKNSAFLGQKMKGRVVGIYNQNQLVTT